MAPAARVTVTLPLEVVADIDRRDSNRSRFVLLAVKREIERQRREELRRSLRNSHPDAMEVAEAGLAEWSASLPEEDAEGLVDVHRGRPVKWVDGEGWREVRR